MGSAYGRLGPRASGLHDMAIVQELNIYPVKSCRGIPLQSARIVASGLEWDRHWMIIDATGSFVTQRTHPQLARIQPTIEGESLVLRQEGFSPCHVPLEPQGEPMQVA